MQAYEKYWKLTVEYTDINDKKFIETLKIIVKFIDNNDMSIYKKSLYKMLQDEVYTKYPKSDKASIRKSINQFIKLGFINNELKSYHTLTKDFLSSKSRRKRRNIFSNIFYSNSKLNAATTKPSYINHIHFLIRTLEEVGSLSKSDIEGLMTVDIAKNKKGYLTDKEVKKAREYAKKIGFSLRKYNQVGYLFNFLGKLNDIKFVSDRLYFEEDAKEIFGEYLDTKDIKKRDPYLHRLYKNQLKEESIEKYKRSQCMLEKLDYPVLIASHIKPFIKSTKDEAYDPNNGLLLSRTIDSLFDLNYISFNDDGTILFTNRVSPDIIKFWKGYTLDKKILNKERKKYLEYHRGLLVG